MVVARVDEDGKTLGFDRAHASVVHDYVAQFPRIDLLTMVRILSGLDSSIEGGWDPVYKTDGCSSFPAHQPLLQELDLEHHPLL